MARKKKHPEHVNHERWLVSYADFITLLFAFFVVMFAVGQVDSNKVGHFTKAFSDAIGENPLAGQMGAGILPGAQDTGVGPPSRTSEGSPYPALDGLKNAIADKVKAEDLPPGVTIIRRRNELVLRLADNTLFASGDDRLKDPAVRALLSIADELRKRKVNVRVEGHTDDVPIKNGRFRSNWDLSTSRATAVVMLFANEGNIAPPRLSASGCAEFSPIATNTTPEGRAQNRRVDLVITEIDPKRNDKPEPKAEAKPESKGERREPDPKDASEPEKADKPATKEQRERDAPADKSPRKE
jgi:chemotaxis protein MotB